MDGTPLGTGPWQASVTVRLSQQVHSSLVQVTPLSYCSEPPASLRVNMHSSVAASSLEEESHISDTAASEACQGWPAGATVGPAMCPLIDRKVSREEAM